MADNIDNNHLSDSDSDSDEVTELQSLIEYYFSRGFQYQSINNRSPPKKTRYSYFGTDIAEVIEKIWSSKAISKLRY